MRSIITLCCLIGLAVTPSRGAAATERLVAPGQTLEQLRAYLRPLVPKLSPPRERGAWQAEAHHLRRQLLDQVVLRGAPRSWLDHRARVVWGETLEGEGYSTRKLRYEALPGLWVGALLYLPAQLQGRLPAVLNLNGHVHEPGMAIDYKQARCINLARRGMVALSPEWFGHGQLRMRGNKHHDVASLELLGVSGLAPFYLALARALDVLVASPQVDASRIAVTGLSGGGWQALLIAALDDRVAAAAPVAGYIGVAERIDHVEDIGDFEQVATDLLAVADYPHLTALLAPRPALLTYNARDECCFRADRARPSVFDPVVPFYSLFNSAHAFGFHVNTEPGTHNYLSDNREALYRFLNQHLQPRRPWIARDLPVDKELRSAAALAVDYPSDNQSLLGFAASLEPERARRAAKACDKPRCWKRLRATLRGLIKLDRYPRVRVERVGTKRAQARERIPGLALQRLHLGQRWTLPALRVEQAASAAANTIVLSDEGMHAEKARVLAAAGRGEAVIAADLFLTGEWRPSRRAGGYIMLVSALGRRPLGIQVGQLTALVKHLEAQGRAVPMRVEAVGPVSALAALTMAALHPGRFAELVLYRAPKSLRGLSRQRLDYLRAPSLFCFGLLEQVDLEDLASMAAPTKVSWERRR